MFEKESEEARGLSLISIYKAGSGHPGGTLSCIDVIVYLFKKEMKFDAKDFTIKERDRFILSKGHCAPALYAVGSISGIIEKSRLNGLRKINHELQGHPCRTATPWVEASTGSLGQGFSFAIGEAKGMKMQDIKNKVYVMVGDGELQEGQIWEGAMFSAHHKLDNLCVIVDYNKMQSDNLNENIMGLEPLADKWASFGLNVVVINGHNFKEIEAGFQSARDCSGKPTAIIANTIKGKGVSYMAGLPAWHGSAKLTDSDISQALLELNFTQQEIKRVINV